VCMHFSNHEFTASYRFGFFVVVYSKNACLCFILSKMFIASGKHDASTSPGVTRAAMNGRFLRADRFGYSSGYR
jgi:hypothetical protein